MSKLPEIHPSHRMSEWESTIVTIVATPRFGSLRRCLDCEAEQALTAAGSGTHDELLALCTCRDDAAPGGHTKGDLSPAT